MSCNVISNSDFESGIHYWIPTPATSAIVESGPLAWSGTHYLDVQTTPENPSGAVYQDLYWLDDEKSHELRVQVRLPAAIPGVDSCDVYAYLGDDAEAGFIASDQVRDGSWHQLTGTIKPDVRNTTLSLAATCSFDGEATEAEVIWDYVVFSDCYQE
ncbi:hypothetical protein BJX76DRAFT_359549 [Aspergillus varians]